MLVSSLMSSASTEKFHDRKMKLFSLFAVCSGYRLYQNINMRTGETEFEQESRLEEFNRVFKKQSRGTYAKEL